MLCTWLHTMCTCCFPKARWAFGQVSHLSFCVPSFFVLTGTSQLKQNAKAHSYICSICRTAFLCTTSEKMLRDHVAAKHDKATFEVRLSAERPIYCAVY